MHGCAQRPKGAGGHVESAIHPLDDRRPACPHSGHTPEERASWWNSIRELLYQFKDLVLLIDGNARVGSVQSNAVGGGGFAQEEDFNGRHLHELLIEHDLWAPSTFEAPTEGSGWTWSKGKTNPRTGEEPKKHRLDYICYPQAWRNSHAAGEVWYDFDAFGEKDHFPHH